MATCGATDWACLQQQQYGGGQCQDWDTDCLQRQQSQFGGGQQCNAWDTDCLQRQRLQMTPVRPLAAAGGPLTFFGVAMALLLLVGLPFLIVGVSLRWSFNKWPSKASPPQKQEA